MRRLPGSPRRDLVIVRTPKAPGSDLLDAFFELPGVLRLVVVTNRGGDQAVLADRPFLVLLEHPGIGQHADRINESRIRGHELVAVDDPETAPKQDRQDRMQAE